MNLDLDSGGALVNATLAAKTIEPTGGATSAAHEGHAANCANCGATLAGNYCHRCGQSAHVHHSLLHLGEEFLHGLLHFDAKAWRTLPLLVIQPGILTRNYIDGKRTRYVSPLALFLFMVFLMFFVVSSVSHVGHTDAIKNLPGPSTAIAADIAQAEQKSKKASDALAALRRQNADPAAIAAAVVMEEKARAQLRDLEQAKAAVGSVAGDGDEDTMDKVVGKLQKKQDRIDTGSPAIDKALKGALNNPQLTLYKLKSAASKYSFLLVPMSLPFLWLMFFWKRGITMYDHAVFSLYALSFMALLVIVVSLLGMAGLSAAAGILVCVAPPIHMFVQLRGAYRLRKRSALWRTVVLLFVSLGVFVLYLLTILTLSVAM